MSASFLLDLLVQRTNESIAVVGGIPEPVGGVTTFLSRLIQADQRVEALYDLYPSQNKKLPTNYSGEYIYFHSKWMTLAKLWIDCFFSKRRIFHFNFSTPRALSLLFFLPKFKSKWIVTLHHGNLNSSMSWVERRVLTRKIDFACYLGKRQAEWYGKYIGEEKMIASSSYVPAVLCEPEVEVKRNIENLRERFSTIYVCSGYPRKLYNHEMAVEFIVTQPNAALICCIYGDGSEKERLKELSLKVGNFILFDSLLEGDFNYILASSDFYLRLNSEDSFGIAVADAVNFGVTTIATNVCDRYAGAVLIDTPQSGDCLKQVIEDLARDPGAFQKSHGTQRKFEYPQRVFAHESDCRKN